MASDPVAPDAAPPRIRVLAAKIAAPAADGLTRPRLLARLDRVWDRAMALVVAPAGSGKTTLLAQWAAACGAPVGWYHAEAGDASPEHLLAHLEAALGLGSGWNSPEQAAQDLGAWTCARAAIVVDDLHLLRGTGAERALARLAQLLPSSVRLVLASRQQPGFDLIRPRLDGRLVELGSAELRFQSWEVEELFHRHYGVAMLPDEVAAVSRRTEGWAAGLQLFHLATAGQPWAKRRQVLHDLRTHPRLLRDYLAANVLDGLPAELGEFMVRSAPLGVLTGSLCDAFLGREGSGALLEDLERRQVFVSCLDSGRTYRYHEVIRGHMEGLLVQQMGEAAARALHHRAGALLAQAARLGEGDGDPVPGAAGAALRALCRAEAPEEVARLLGERGEDLAGGALAAEAGNWLDALPVHLVSQDPWLQLASARRHLAAGRLAPALEAYRAAEPGLPQASAETCRQEMLQAGAWVSPVPPPARDWAGILRRAAARDPMAAVAAGDAMAGPGGRVIAGVACLLAGELDQARHRLQDATAGSIGPAAEVVARLGVTLAQLQEGGDRARAVEDLSNVAQLADSLGQVWLGRQARAAMGLAGHPEVAAAARRACQTDGDTWGELVAGLYEGMGWLRQGGDPVPALTWVAGSAHELGAGVIEAWARASLAMAAAQADEPGAGALALSAEAVALAAELPRAVALCRSALALAGAPGAAATRVEAVSPVEPSGLGGVELRCLGGLQLLRAGCSIDLTGIRPRARALLALLALHAPRAAHWEVLAEALWPGCPPAAASHNLQAAVSAVRRALGRLGDGPAGGSVLARRGEAYLLVVTGSDLADFEAGLGAARRARAAGDGGGETAGLEGALAAYRGELLPEFGPAEWLVRERDRLRSAAADAAVRLVELDLARGDAHAAARVAEAGVAIDPYRDALWEGLVSAAERAGDRGRAMVARQRWDAALADLGAWA